MTAGPSDREEAGGPTDATLRRLAVCADDFGLSNAVSRVIFSLAAAGRLTALSCLVTGPAWRCDAALLRDLPPQVAPGLHFDLTQHPPLSADLRRYWQRPPSLPTLMTRAACRALPRRALEAEWRAQWRAFVEAAGRAPAFIDGHQHVHHLPGVREGLLDLLAQQPPGVAVRNTGRIAGPGYAGKRALIACSGGRGLQRLLRLRGIAHNAVLTGVYDFRFADYRRLMQGWLRALPPDGALLMCHPGDGEGGLDAIAAARRREAHYLGSWAFVDDLAEAGITLAPAWQARSSSAG